MTTKALLSRCVLSCVFALILGGMIVTTQGGAVDAKTLSHDCLSVDRARKSKATIYFAVGSTYLNDHDKAQLNRVAYDGKYAMKVCIVGQADKQGNAAANMALAKRRAQAIASYLASRGVLPRNIEIGARGEAFNDALDDLYPRAQDRRVDIYFVSDST